MSITAKWKKKATLTIDYTLVEATETDYVVYYTEACFQDDFLTLGGADAMDSTGKDFRITSDAAGLNELPFHIIKISLNATPANSKFVVAVNHGSVSSVADTVSTTWFGNPSAVAYARTDPFGQNATYPSKYKGIYNCSESQVDDDPEDSTGNSNDGTYAASAKTPVTGKIGDAAHLGSSSGERIDIPDDSSLDLTPKMHISFWFNAQAAIASGSVFMAKWLTGTSYIVWSLSAGQIRFRGKFSGVDKDAISSSSYGPSDGWVFVTCEYDGANMYLHINGGAESITGDAVTGDVDLSTEDLSIAAYSGFAGLHVNAYFNIARFANDVGGVDQHKTDFNSQDAPGTFATQGTIEASGLLDIKRFISIT